MKKMFFVSMFFVLSFVLMGCEKEPTIQPVQNLTELQTEITRISNELISGSLTPEAAQELFEQLQAKYTELTQKELLDRMEGLKTIIKEKQDAQVSIGTLPHRAQDLGLSLPQKMRFNKTESRQTRLADKGYDSFLYVYKGPYAYALKEAARIASGAHLFPSQEVAEAQLLLEKGVSITGLDTEKLSQGIVYTNHRLTETNIDYLISVSVDGDGVLIIEAVNYKQMKK